MSRRTRAAAVVFALLMVAAPASGAVEPAGLLGAPAGPADRGATTGAVTAPSVADGDATNTTNGTEADADTTRTAATRQSGTDDAAAWKLSAALRGERGATADRSVTAASVDDATPVTVVVLTEPGAAESVASAVRALDGTVELVHGDAVQATLSRAALGSLAERSDVSYVRKPRTPEPTVVSEGVGSINATALHDRGVTGENVTVAVVDVGGFNLSNPELDDVVAHRNYHGDGIGNGTVGAHGTATAALVSDAAPGANVVAVRVETYLQAQAAVAWLRENTSVDAVSMSLGWKDVGPLDGTAPLSEEIQRSVDAGTPYFVAAGNAGDGNHWDGQWSDPDGDGWLNFAGDDELMTVSTVSPGSPMFFALQWDDWPGSDEDYALYVYQYESDFDDGAPDGGTTYEVVDTAQTGSQEPLELFEMSSAYNDYYVAVRSQNADNSSNFTAFAGDAQRLSPSTSARSVTEPGVAPAATTVGAVDAATGELEPFSSRGPTVDGRRKPDLVGPDNVSTGAYAGSNFYGTSAAVPHAAGAAALLLGVDPDLSPAEVETTLAETASPVTGSEPNSRAGAGLVDAGAAVASVDGGDTGSGVVDTRPGAGAPASASAGNVTVGGAATVNVTVTNDGDAPLSVAGTETTGPNASAFDVTSAPATVAPGASGTVTVQFAPTSVGAQRATLSVAHNASGSPLTVGLSGTGVGTASVRVSANRTFGDVSVGETATRNVAVGNDGSAPLSLTGTEVTGPNASAFTVTNASATVAPGGNGTVTVQFAPTSVGSRQATLSVDHDADGSPATVQLSGTGVGTPTVDVQGSLSFGEVSVGGAATGTVDVTNGGNAPLSLTGTEVTGADAGAFAVTDAPATVAPGSTATVTVEFAPAGAGARQATLSVAHNASGSPATVALGGTGAGTATVDARDGLPFGEVSVGGTASEEVTVTNEGNVPLSVTEVGMTGPNASAFTVTDAPATVDAGASGAVVVEFAPTGAGEHEATLTVEHDGDGSPTTVALTGTGAGTAELGAPASREFGTVRVGETVARNVTVENVGTGPLSLTAVTASEAFAVVGDPTGTLAPGETRAVAVEWTPAARSNGSAGTLTLDHDGAGSPASVDLSGRAVAGNVSLSAAEAVRANVTLGSNATYDVTVRNTGDAAVRVSGVGLADAAPGYAVSNASFDLAPGAERVLSVAFTPEATGERGATVRVSHNASSSPTELRLSATVPQPSDGDESDGGDGSGDGDENDNGGDSGDDGGDGNDDGGDDGSDGGSSGGGGGGGDGPATDFRVVDLSSGATVTVDEAVTDEPVEADTGVSGAGVTVESLRLAFRFDAADFRIEVGTPTASPEGVPALADATPVAYFRAESVGLNARRLDGATVSLTVPELPAGASPEDVVVYRLVDGSWTPLETTNVGGDGYEAQTDGFTAFAVGVQTDTAGGDGANATTGTPNATDAGTETATAEEAPALGETDTAAVGGATETTTPGFGASAALVALLALAGALLLVRRR